MYLVILLISGAEAGLHFALHHRTHLAMAAVGAAGWVGNRTHIPLLASHPGSHRPSSHTARKALRRKHKAAMRKARKAVAA